MLRRTRCFWFRRGEERRLLRVSHRSSAIRSYTPCILTHPFASLLSPRTGDLLRPQWQRTYGPGLGDSIAEQIGKCFCTLALIRAQPHSSALAADQLPSFTPAVPLNSPGQSVQTDIAAVCDSRCQGLKARPALKDTITDGRLIDTVPTAYYSRSSSRRRREPATSPYRCRYPPFLDAARRQ